jgi:hypothetical protein
MRVVAAWGAALALLAPLPAWAQATDPLDGEQGLGQPVEGMEHVTPGQPRRGPVEAIRRDKFDDAVERMFASADTDRGGTVALAELRAVIEARKDAAIRGRFAGIDTNRDQSVSFAEFNQWQRGLGSAVLTDEAAAAASNIVVADDVAPAPMSGPGGRVLARLVAPLNATMLFAADTDHDGAASLAEIAAYEGKRFEAADSDKDGWVTEEEQQGPAGR